MIQINHFFLKKRRPILFICFSLVKILSAPISTFLFRSEPAAKPFDSKISKRCGRIRKVQKFEEILLDIESPYRVFTFNSAKWQISKIEEKEKEKEIFRINK